MSNVSGKLCAALLLFIGVINLLPVMVAFLPERTISLYGVVVRDDALLILIRHRAVLLSLLGMALIYSAFKPLIRAAAIVGALTSKVTFITLLFIIGNSTPEIKGVAVIDAFAIVGLLIALTLHWRSDDIKADTIKRISVV